MINHKWKLLNNWVVLVGIHMVVKSKIGRKRYIVIKIESEQMITKRDLVYTINGLVNNRFNIGPNKDKTSKETNNKSDSNLLEKENKNQNSNHLPSNNLIMHKKTYTPWVIFIKKNYGLIRCQHLDKEKTIELLNSVSWVGKRKTQVKIQTLGTTGTIQSAMKKYLDKLILYPLNN